jgi:hypothetical protein
MSCRKIRQYLSRYYRGELSKEQEELITQHIQECEGCSKEAQSYKTLNQAIECLETYSPSPDFGAKLESRIRELSYPKIEPKAKPLVTSFPSLRWALIPIGVLTLFLLLKIGFFKSQPDFTSKETDLVKMEDKVAESGKISPSVDSFVQVNSQNMIPANLLGKKENHRAVYIMDNLNFADIRRLPDSKMVQRELNNYVMDAVNFKPVDDRRTNEAYVLPAVSTMQVEAKRSY